MKTTIASITLGSSLLLCVGLAQANTWLDSRLSSYGERHELSQPPNEKPHALVAAEPLPGLLVADMLLGSDIPVNPLLLDDRLSVFGERHDLRDPAAPTEATLAGSEDLNTSLPPTAAGYPEPDGYESDMNAVMTTD